MVQRGSRASVILAPSLMTVGILTDMGATWKRLATSKGIVIDARTGMRIIVDDVFSWAPTFDNFIKYLTCQLQVCLSQNLSLFLKKYLFSREDGVC